jgi:hypothetical protein
MLRKAIEEKKVKGKVARTMKEALDAITIEALEEWSRMLLEQSPLGAGPGPMTLLGEEAMNHRGRGHHPTQPRRAGEEARSSQSPAVSSGPLLRYCMAVYPSL